MPGFKNLSIKTILMLLISTMGLLLIALSASSVMEALDRNKAALRTASLTEVSQHLFKALIATRLERGATTNGLVADGPIDAATQGDLSKYRRLAEEGYEQSLALLGELEQRESADILQSLKQAHEKTVVMRSQADAELHRSKAERDAGLVANYPKVTQSLLDVIVASADQLEASMKLVDPVVDQLLSVKRAAWTARLYLGLMATRTQTTVAAGRPFTSADVLAWSQDQARAVLAWKLVTEAASRSDASKPIVAAVATAEDNFSGRVANARKAVVDTLTAGQTVNTPISELMRSDTENNGLVVTVADVALDQMVQQARDRAMAARASLISNAAVLFAALVLAIVGSAIVLRRVSRPIQAMTDAMRRLAAQDMSVAIPGIGRGDEIGAMASAVQVFKDNALHAKALEQEQAAARRDRAAEDERVRREAEQAAAAKAAHLVVNSIGAGLDRLAAGDLTFRLETMLPEDYEKLRLDLNSAMNQLQETMKSVSSNTTAIWSGSNEISQASDDLSRRTEQQAASLEQTAAALDEITATVRKTSEGSIHARQVVSDAKADAERSGIVVRQAVQAMSAIENSSRQISQIIGVIDEIAFQTNLLALNAGVEAARAGDAGRGFAVVASEVRGLAQRSAEAAKEIKALISTSSRLVGEGVELVGVTGQALERIVVQVGEINSIVTDIAASTQEQATALAEVNTAINQMDQVTQQNAAMVEESTAASHGLKQEAEGLANLVGTFQVGPHATIDRIDAKRPGRKSSRQSAILPGLKLVGRGGAVRKAEAAPDEGWAEF